MKVILANYELDVKVFLSKNNLDPKEYVVARTIQSLQGLRFRYEDVIRLPGWSKRSDIEEMEDRILRTHVAMGYPDDVCTFGTALH